MKFLLTERIFPKRDPGLLYRNGKRIIDGRIAFDENRKQVEGLTKSIFMNSLGYPGYRSEGLLTNRELITVPDKNSSGTNAYFAMGDNSTDSLDGRAWGFVPDNEIIGRALLVYYPFTKRWGFQTEIFRTICIMSNYGISDFASWLNNRAAGVLLHPSSLPGNQGIGSLGKEARRFIDFLESAGFRYWQTCPVGQLVLEIHLIKYFVQTLVIRILLIGFPYLKLAY